MQASSTTLFINISLINNETLVCRQFKGIAQGQTFLVADPHNAYLYSAPATETKLFEPNEPDIAIISQGAVDFNKSS